MARLSGYMPNLRKAQPNVAIVFHQEDKENSDGFVDKFNSAAAASSTPRTEAGPVRHAQGRALSPVAGNDWSDESGQKPSISFSRLPSQLQQHPGTPIRGVAESADSEGVGGTRGDNQKDSSKTLRLKVPILALDSAMGGEDLTTAKIGSSLPFSPPSAYPKKASFSESLATDAAAAVAMPQDEYEPAPTPSAPSAAPNADAESAPTPAPPPVTPAPPRPAGEVAVQNWLEDSGLMEMDGLLSALVVVAPDLTRLSQLSDEKLLDALKPLKLRSLKIRKIHAAIIVLRQEREAFVRSTIGSTTSPSTDDGSTPGSHHGHYSHQNYSDRPGEVYVRGREGSERRDSGECSEDGEASEISPTAAAAHDFVEPPHPRLGERNRAGFGRFLPRTEGGRTDLVPPSPESAAAHLGLTGPSEARELGELATLLGGGRASARASKWESNIHAGVLASAAAREAAVAREMAEASRKEERLKVDHSEARAAFGDLAAASAAVVTPRSKKQIDALRLIDLQTRLDMVASSMGDVSPERMMMMEANAPRDPQVRAESVKVAQKRKVPRKKQPPVAPTSTRVTRSMSAAANAAANAASAVHAPAPAEEAAPAEIN